jgi:Domain of unknown function (DUF4331)
MQVIRKSRWLAAIAATLWFAGAATYASDHLDTAAVIADPASDIGDLYAWTSSDGKQLNLVMTIVGRKFSDHVRYEFHVDSGRRLGETSGSITIGCEFLAVTAAACQAGDVDQLRGEAGGVSGIGGERGKFRVFAGLRDDPFFNNVRGTRAALYVASAALLAGASRDSSGCPRFDTDTSATILEQWRQTDGHAGSNFLAGWNTAALVVAVDLDVVNRGGPLLGVWATTTVRAAPPGHAPLEAGVQIDRVGRALTGNALIGTFDSEEASGRRKAQYNEAAPPAWPTFGADLAATLAMYDGFDGVCGNQWLAPRESSAVDRYQRLALLLADDRLWVDSRMKHCERYLAVEIVDRTARPDCGGRTPDYDAVDVFRSLLVNGRTTGVDDGVPRDDRRPSAEFPYIAAPGEPN